MRKLFFWVMSLCLFANSAFADCDWTQIKDNGNGTYNYSKELHICVGQTVQDNKIKDQQVKDLNQAIQLKDLVIQKADQRAQLWMDTSFKLEDNIQKMDSLKKTNEWLYFGLGALTVLGSGFMAAQLLHR